jgi:isoleucyl-tRNA synthetase
VSGNDVRFSGESVRDAVRRFNLPLWNSLHYFSAYASIDRFAPSGTFPALTRLDRYLLDETDALRADVEAAMDAYDFVAVYDRLEAYIQTLSAWYIRLTRPRLWREGMDDDKRTAYEVLYAALSTVARVMAPFLPFLAESIWARLGQAESVHLQDWPAPRADWRAPDIEIEMRTIREVVRLARSIREKNAVKTRQPLRRLLVSGLPPHVLDANVGLLQEELNVKDVAELDSPLEYVERRVTLEVAKLGKRLRGDLKKAQAAVKDGTFTLRADGRLEAAGVVLEPDEFTFRYAAREGGMDAAAEGDLVVLLDLATDPALVREGHARELNRALQDMRKKAGLAYADRVIVSVRGGTVAQEVLAHHGPWLADQVLAERLSSDPLATPLVTEAVDLGEESVSLALARR